MKKYTSVLETDVGGTVYAHIIGGSNTSSSVSAGVTVDRVVTIWAITNATLWIAGGVLVVAGVCLPEWRLGVLGLYLTCAAVVATVCRAVQSSHRAQRNAFELGRDAERYGGEVRHMRR